MTCTPGNAGHNSPEEYPLITISEVTSRNDFHRFFSFPSVLYRKNPYYVPSLIYDEAWNFNPKKNPAYRHAETACFLAWEHKRVVGRIAALILRREGDEKFSKTLRFNRFDMIDSLDVTRALIDRAAEWGRQRGMEYMIGPIGFSDLDKQGLLVEGFDQPGMFITLYNHPYYAEHLEALGFVKEVDWVEYKIKVPDTADPRIARICEMAQHRYKLRLLSFRSKRQALPYVRKAFAMYNRSYANLYGFIPLTDDQVEMAIRQFFYLVNLEYVSIVVTDDDDVVGLGIMVPSLSHAVRKSKGRLFPLGWLRIMRALKEHTLLDMYLIAVQPEYQGRGVNAIILNDGITKAVAHGVIYAETGPELEDNRNVQSQWKGFEKVQHKRRRCYGRPIA